MMFFTFCRFSTCWPAFQKDANGVVIVYNPDEANHDKELETWYERHKLLSFYHKCSGCCRVIHVINNKEDVSLSKGRFGFLCIIQ